MEITYVHGTGYMGLKQTNVMVDGAWKGNVAEYYVPSTGEKGFSCWVFGRGHVGGGLMKAKFSSQDEAIEYVTKYLKKM